MSLVKEQSLFLLDVAKLIIFASQQGIVLTGGELYRTQDQQNLYYHGKTVREDHQEIELKTAKKKSKVKYSQHQKRLAIDFNFFINGRLTYAKKDIKILGEYWEALNPKNRWGGKFSRFPDTPHFERKI